MGDEGDEGVWGVWEEIFPPTLPTPDTLPMPNALFGQRPVWPMLNAQYPTIKPKV